MLVVQHRASHVLGHLFVGSTLHGAAAHAHCPVISVRTGWTPPEAPKVDPKDTKKKDPAPMPKGPQPARKFKVTIAPDVPVGQYDVRVINKWGVSNPRAFCVGDLIVWFPGSTSSASNGVVPTLP